MNDSDSSRPPIGLWTLIALALILSVTSIVLHITAVTDRGSNQFERTTMEYQQVTRLFQQLQSEHNKLQAAIADSPNYHLFRQSMKPSSQPVPVPPISAQTDSPMAALMVLEQSRMRNSFDDYQQIHPKDQQKILEQIYITNRELKFAYDELKSMAMLRYLTDDMPGQLIETDSERLGRLIFKGSNRYELLETKKSGDTQAELKVRLKIEEDVPATHILEVKLNAVKDGANWKISDHPGAIAHHDKVLARMKQRLKDCKALTQRCNQGELKLLSDFNKAWESLPKDE